MGPDQASRRDISPHRVELHATAALWTLLYRLNKCLSSVLKFTEFLTSLILSNTKLSTGRLSTG